MEQNVVGFCYSSKLTKESTMNKRIILILLVVALVVFAFSINLFSGEKGTKMKDEKEKIAKKADTDDKDKVQLSEDEWKKILSPEQYRVIRQCGTEPPFTGKYYNHHDTGTYACAACGNDLFLSDAKYESGSGWPSFWEAVDSTKILELRDTTLGMIRTEIKCARCNAHLGHVFEDGPPPTGLRYCVNSASLKFVKQGEEKNETAAEKMADDKTESN